MKKAAAADAAAATGVVMCCRNITVLIWLIGRKSVNDSSGAAGIPRAQLRINLL